MVYRGPSKDPQSEYITRSQVLCDIYAGPGLVLLLSADCQIVCNFLADIQTMCNHLRYGLFGLKIKFPFLPVSRLSRRREVDAYRSGSYHKLTDTLRELKLHWVQIIALTSQNYVPGEIFHGSK